MPRIEKIIFICTGNTCRSPMAETIYQGLVSESPVKTVSRGLVVLFPEPVNQKADMVLKNHGLSMENHVATQLAPEDVDEGTLLLTMTEDQKRKVAEEYGITSRIYTVKEYAGEEGDVLDPYGGSVLEYEDCFVELSRLMKKTVIRLLQENNKAGRDKK